MATAIPLPAICLVLRGGESVLSEAIFVGHRQYCCAASEHAPSLTAITETLMTHNRPAGGALVVAPPEWVSAWFQGSGQGTWEAQRAFNFCCHHQQRSTSDPCWNPTPFLHPLLVCPCRSFSPLTSHVQEPGLSTDHLVR